MSAITIALPFSWTIVLGTLPLTCSVEEAPPRVSVASRSLASVSFHKATATLEVEFRSGAMYRYRGVSEATYAGLLRAESKGRYFSARIRGKHPFQRVRQVTP